MNTTGKVIEVKLFKVELDNGKLEFLYSDTPDTFNKTLKRGDLCEVAYSKGVLKSVTKCWDKMA